MPLTLGVRQVDEVGFQASSARLLPERAPGKRGQGTEAAGGFEEGKRGEAARAPAVSSDGVPPGKEELLETRDDTHLCSQEPALGVCGNGRASGS